MRGCEDLGNVVAMSPPRCVFEQKKVVLDVFERVLKRVGEDMMCAGGLENTQNQYS
jgi:hypothetical protein